MLVVPCVTCKSVLLAELYSYINVCFCLFMFPRSSMPSHHEVALPLFLTNITSTICLIVLTFCLLMVAALTPVNLVEKILDLDPVVIATMNTYWKFGFRRELVKILTWHIFIICMRKQWRVSGTVLLGNLSLKDWFSLGNCPMELTASLVQKWITWYVVVSQLVASHNHELVFC